MPEPAASPAGSTVSAGGAGAVAPPAKMKLKKKSDSLPGEKLGFPMYQAISGNLPVLSTQFWTSPDGEAGAGATDYEHMTGNLPIISSDLIKEDDMQEMPPGWVQLIDPILKRKFWWNIYYKCRREKRPGFNDDGHKGARKGEEYTTALHAEWKRHMASAEGPEAYAKLPPCFTKPVEHNPTTPTTPLTTPSAGRNKRFSTIPEETDPENPDAKLWVEQWSLVEGRPYYINTCEHTSQWEKPEGFATSGEAYASKWEEKWDAETSSSYWYNRRDHSRVTTRPDDFDNTPLIDSWVSVLDEGSGHTYYWNTATDVKTWERPADWPRAQPVGPPPSPPPSPEKPSPLAEDAHAGAGIPMLPASPGSVLPASPGSVLDLHTLELAALKLVGAKDAEEDEEDDTLIFPNFRGYLKKKGGGTSIFGRRNWKERFCVVSKGFMAYFDSQDDWEKGKQPLKGVLITLRLYKINPVMESPTQFELVPLDASEIASASFEEEAAVESPTKAKIHKPMEKRAFMFDAPSPEMKARWIKVLRGRRADGRHRADSGEFASYIAAARTSSVVLSK